MAARAWSCSGPGPSAGGGSRVSSSRRAGRTPPRARQPAGHFEGDAAAHRPAREHQRAAFGQRIDQVEVTLGELADGRRHRNGRAVGDLEGVDGVGVAQVPGQRHERQGRSADRVDQHHHRLVRPRVQLDEMAGRGACPGSHAVGEFADSGREQVDGIRFGPQFGVADFDEAEGEQRMPAQFDKVVGEPDPVDGEHATEDVDQPRVELVARRHGFPFVIVGRLQRVQQCALVGLAVDIRRDCLDLDDLRGEHVRRQQSGGVGEHVFGIEQAARCGNGERDQARIAVPLGQHDAVGHRRMLGHHCLDLCGLDPHPADLDLPIDPA